MILFSCTVLGTPVPQGRIRVPRWGKPYYPARSKAHRALLVAAFSAAWKQPAINEPVRVSIHLYGAPVNSDLDNHAKQIMDALQEAGVLESDDVRVVRYLFVENHEARRKDRRTTVEVTKAWN